MWQQFHQHFSLSTCPVSIRSALCTTAEKIQYQDFLVNIFGLSIWCCSQRILWHARCRECRPTCHRNIPSLYLILWQLLIARIILNEWSAEFDLNIVDLPGSVSSTPLSSTNKNFINLLSLKSTTFATRFYRPKMIPSFGGGLHRAQGSPS
jgi:hypothetical protein